MSLENVRKVIAFLQRSRYPVFRAMGGEPTMHPDFQEIVEFALRERMRVDLLSNATWQPRYNDFFKRISPSNLLFLLNVDHPEKYPSDVFAGIEKNLDALSGRKGVSLSFNIFESKPRHEYIFHLASKYDIRAARLSFSLPVIEEQNACLEIEQYEQMVPFIMEFIRKGESQNISVRLDNAIPLCIFSNEEAGELLLKGALDLERNARCRPVVDIGPDLTLWYCFCLSRLYNRDLEEFDSLEEIEKYFDQIMKPYQDNVFPMEKCYTCDYRHTWGCQGGCITFSVRRNRQGLEEETLSEEAQKSVFALAEDVTIEQHEIPDTSYFIMKTSTGEGFEISPSFKRLLDLLDGQTNFEEALDKFFAVGGGATDMIDNFSNDVLRENLRDFFMELFRKGFLISSRGCSVRTGSSTNRAHKSQIQG